MALTEDIIKGFNSWRLGISIPALGTEAGQAHLTLSWDSLENIVETRKYLFNHSKSLKQ